MRYLCWTPPYEHSPPPEGKLSKVTFGLLGVVVRLVLPLANPDYDHRIGTVSHWWIEVDDCGIPQREIGFDCDGIPIMAMPEGRNYGYITDSNMTFEQDENDATVEAMFEEQWRRALTGVEKKAKPA